MCRHLAYLGPAGDRWPSCCLDPPHSLLRQSWAPRDMRGGGTVNADGFGVGWYPARRPSPVRYRRSVPIWADPSVAALAAVTRARAVLAAVRLGTVGHAGTARPRPRPFADGRWLFSHNGVVARLAGRRWSPLAAGCR